jgi:hypothetical protein
MATFLFADVVTKRVRNDAMDISYSNNVEDSNVLGPS